MLIYRDVLFCLALTSEHSRKLDPSALQCLITYLISLETEFNNIQIVHLQGRSITLYLTTVHSTRLLIISDKRKRDRFLSSLHTFSLSTFRGFRTVQGAALSPEAHMLPSPRPPGTRRKRPGRRWPLPPAQGPPFLALTRHANGLQHRPAEAAGGGLRGRWGRGPDRNPAGRLQPPAVPQTRGRGGRLLSATGFRITRVRTDGDVPTESCKQRSLQPAGAERYSKPPNTGQLLLAPAGVTLPLPRCQETRAVRVRRASRSLRAAGGARDTASWLA